MFPLRDDNPTLRTPIVTILLIATNVIVWLYVQGGGVSELALGESVCTFGAIPAEVTGRTGTFEGIELDPSLPPCAFGGLTWATVVTSLFLHGSWVHLLANMWFLWLFGNNVEDSMGRTRFLLFYLLTGVAATGAHIAAEPGSMLPLVGASGAISGVMGAYLVLYPRIQIRTLFIVFVFLRIVPVAAWFVLLLWFGLQLLSGYLAPVGQGGVAFWAHAGGFVAGVVLVKLFEDRGRVAEKRRDPRPLRAPP